MDKQKYLDLGINLEKTLKSYYLTDSIKYDIQKYIEDTKKELKENISRVSLINLGTKQVISFISEKTVEELEEEVLIVTKKLERKKEISRKISESLKESWKLRKEYKEKQRILLEKKAERLKRIALLKKERRERKKREIEDLFNFIHNADF